MAQQWQPVSCGRIEFTEIPFRGIGTDGQTAGNRVPVTDTLKRLQVCGAPRSGTTLMLELLRNGFHWDWVAAEEVSVSRPLPVSSGRCLSKRPNDAITAHLMLTDPDIWFVYCQRDPRDIVSSRHGLAPDLYWTNLRYYRMARAGAMRCRGHDRFITVRYETLVNDPDSIQDEIAGRIAWLERKAPFSQYHQQAEPSQQSLEAMRGLRPVTSAGIGRWRDNLPRVYGQVLIHGSIAADLIEDGYEKDDRWMDVFEGVLPDATPGYLPEKLTSWRRLRRLAWEYWNAARYLAGRAAGRIPGRRPAAPGP